MDFYDDKAEQYFGEHYEQLVELGFETVDKTALMNLSNLYAQNIELMQLLREQGYVVVNRNTKNQVTTVINPIHTAYSNNLSKMYQLQSKLYMLPKDRAKLTAEGIVDDAFQEMFGEV